ncbi:MAG: hypothetical protein V1815_00260 [Candidatus Woesearchaeota archaeon]
MKAFIEIIIGLLIILAIVYFTIYYPTFHIWESFKTLFKGSIFVILIFIGLIMVIIGFNEIRE